MSSPASEQPPSSPEFTIPTDTTPAPPAPHPATGPSPLPANVSRRQFYTLIPRISRAYIASAARANGVPTPVAHSRQLRHPRWACGAARPASAMSKPNEEQSAEAASVAAAAKQAAPAAVGRSAQGPTVEVNGVSVLTAPPPPPPLQPRTQPSTSSNSPPIGVAGGQRTR